MKKKLLLCAGIVVMIAVIILGVWRYVEMPNCQTDPNWKLAEQIYKMENALKELDKDYECKSISKVTPYTYADSSGNTITYYCCKTTYISDEYGEDTGLNTEAIGMVIDLAQIENKRQCTVNEHDAFQCEMGERSYLCWTISPEISCVIEYRNIPTALPTSGPSTGIGIAQLPRKEDIALTDTSNDRMAVLSTNSCSVI